MKSLFKTALFGYQTDQVNQYVSSLRKDYEEELRKKKDRMFELNEENRDLKKTLDEYKEKLLTYEEQELYISKALIKAEENAQEVLRQCHYSRKRAEEKMVQEQEKWKMRENEIRKKLLDYQNEAYSLMDNIQSEINYLTSKELSKAMENRTIGKVDKPDGMSNVSAI